jgi:hypothetical protein
MLELVECYQIRYGGQVSQLSTVNGSEPDGSNRTLGDYIEFEDQCASTMSDSIVYLQQDYLLNKTIDTSLSIGQTLCTQFSSI